MKAEPNPRISIESLEASETVPFIGLHKSDFKFLFGPGFAGLVLGFLAGTALGGLLLGAVLVFVAGLIIYIKPSYMTAMAYVGALREYLQRPTRFTYTTEQNMEPESYFDRVEEDQSTKEITHLERYYRRGVVERDDGQMVAAVKLEPQSMDFSESSDWANVTKIAEQFANNSADFDVTLFVTSRSFPVEEYTGSLEARLDDDDISSLPMLRATLKELLEERPEELQEANLAPLDFYAMVQVGTGEVVTDTTADTSALEKLSQIPVLGIPFSTFATFREDLDELHKRARMMRKLDERISAVQTGLARNIDGFTAHRVGAPEWADILEHYWKSDTPDFQFQEAASQTAPVVLGDEEVPRLENSIEEQLTEETQGPLIESSTSPTPEDDPEEGQAIAGASGDDTTEQDGDSDADTEEEPAPDSLEAAVNNSDFQFESEPDNPDLNTASQTATGYPEIDSEDETTQEESSEDSEEDAGEPDSADGVVGLVLNILLGGENEGDETVEEEKDDTEDDESSEEETSDGIGSLIVDILLSSEDDEGTEGDDEPTDKSESSVSDEEQEDASEESEEDAESDGDDDEVGIAGKIPGMLPFVGSGESEQEDLEAETAPDPSTVKAEQMEQVELPDKGEIQQLNVSPEDIEEKYRSLVVDGTEHRQVLFVESWPKNINVGALRDLFTRSNLDIDLSIHLNPKDREAAVKKAERRVQSLETDATAGLGGFAAQDKMEAAEEAEIVRDYLDNGQRPFEVSAYVVVSAESEEDLRDQVRTVRDIFRDAPANMGLKTLSGNQLPGLQAAAPVGKDTINRDSRFDPTQLMLGQGVGCLLSSMKESTLLEEDGIEFGEHSFNGTPIIKDPFASETNYNWTVIGDSGSGKSYESKLMALRTMMARKNTKLIILDPLEGFFGLSKAMDAEHITIGGDRGLNPLEIRPPADHSQQSDDMDPLAQKIKDVMSFFENFANQQGYEIGESGPILQAAVKNAYRAKGITHDVRTHGNESPTINDVLDCLEDMADNPEDYVVRSVTEVESIQDHASTLIHQLRPFVQGAFQNLAKQSEFDLRGEDVVYLDLSQQEHTASGGGITMQLLFSLVYERAKETPKDVIFLIDEARFLMRDAKNLEFLGQRVRHSRHYNTSIRFITQNIGDFFDHEEAESIINNSFINIFHQTEEIGQWADTFGLNEQEVRYVKNAQTGSNGYSEALVSINNTRYPIQFFATDAEHAIIDFDPRSQSADELPGDAEAKSELAREIRLTLDEIHDESAQELQENREELERVYESLPGEHQEYLSLLDDYELYYALSMINDGEDPSGVVGAAASDKLNQVIGEIIDEQALIDGLTAVYAEHEVGTQQDQDSPGEREPAAAETDD
jgi:hypothetical protein